MTFKRLVESESWVKGLKGLCFHYDEKFSPGAVARIEPYNCSPCAMTRRSERGMRIKKQLQRKSTCTCTLHKWNVLVIQYLLPVVLRSHECLSPRIRLIELKVAPDSELSKRTWANSKTLSKMTCEKRRGVICFLVQNCILSYTTISDNDQYIEIGKSVSNGNHNTNPLTIELLATQSNFSSLIWSIISIFCHF